MKNIGLVKALLLTKRADKMSPMQRSDLQQLRLHQLVAYVKQKSPYFASAYKNISTDFSLSDLPPMNKMQMMSHFDEWLTDRSVNLAKINHFMESIDNIGRKLDGKYLVFTTSGSTGKPCTMLYDDTVMNVSAAIGVFRSFARKEDMKIFIKQGGRTMGLFADKGFYLGTGSIRYKQLKMPWKKKKLATYDVRNSKDKIVKALNDFQPCMLGSYPSALELLVDAQKSGQLHISPAIIMTGGEKLRDSLRNTLREVFGCYVQTNYSCTEGGMMACECTEKHFHINDDWVIIEAVDKNNQPVPLGTQSAKVLLTNLSNFIQPIIRFEITDRIIMHHESCACKKNTPWLEIEGRTDDILEFANNKKIAPLSFYLLLKEIHEISRFQIVYRGNNEIELRIEAENKEKSFQKAEVALKTFLGNEGISASITLADKLPQVDERSGKFKHVYME